MKQNDGEQKIIEKPKDFGNDRDSHYGPTIIRPKPGQYDSNGPDTGSVA